MPGAETPADLALALATDPDDADAAAALEAIAEVQRRTPGVGQSTAASTFEISAGSINPDRGLFLVDTEGAVAADNLDTIAPDNFLPGSLILLAAADSGRVPTIRHLQGGAGQIGLYKNQDFALSGARWILLELRGTIWIERLRDFGGNASDMRAWLELGSAAVLDDGSVDAATLEGNAAAAFLPVAGQAADSALLQGLAAAAFARVDQAAQQDFLGALRTFGGLFTIRTNSAAAALLQLVANSNLRTQVFFDPTSEVFEIRVFDSDGSTITGGIRIRENEIPEFWDTTSLEWTSLVGDSALQEALAVFPGLRRIIWDKLDAFEDLTAGAATHVIRSEPITPLPNTSGDVVYKVRAGLNVTPYGGSQIGGFVRLYIGPNGNATDSLLSEIAVDTGLETQYLFDIEEVFDSYVSGDRLTLVLENISVGGPRVNPSVDNGFTRESRTFLRLEQIG